MSVASIGGSSADVLALLRQHYLAANTSATGGISGSTDSTDSANGSGATSTAANSGCGTAPAGTGSGTSPLDSGMLSILITIQQQQTGASPDTSSGTFDVSQTGAGASGLGQQLFGKLDSNGDGQLSQSELETAVSAAGGSTSQADALFSKLDSNGSGSVSQNEFSKALQGHHHGHHHSAEASAGAGAGGGNSDPLAALLGSLSSANGTGQTSANGDGSSTTTLTYADGTKIALTSPAATNGSAASASAATDTAAAGGQQAQPTTESVLTTLIRLQEQSFQSAGLTDQVPALAA